MNADDFRRVREAFEAALDLPKDERPDFAQSSFPDEEDLRAELASMLRGHDSDPGFLRPPTPATLADAAAPVEAEQPVATALGPGVRVGEFELVRAIGSGGMGTVWEAMQLEPSRRVALKTVRVGIGPEVDRRRFHEEARILARLSHPGIAQVLAAGVLDETSEAGGLPWFAMEFVADARPIDAFARDEALVLEDKLDLVLQVCDAVHHGHLRGVVHRDLKPENLLVGPDGRVKVIDFGIARATEREAETLTTEGQLVGTLLYMSPEQVRGERDRIDVRTDVHALGVLLFQLLCDRSPWPADESFPSLAETIATRDAPRPSELASGVSQELDWIVGKALEKAPERRYASADDLASDLRRFLRHEPLQASPPSAVYRVRKFVRRHAALVYGTAAAFLLLLLGTAGTLFGLARSIEKQEELEEAKGEAEETAARALAQNEYLNKMLSAGDPLGDFVGLPRQTTVAEMLDNASAEIESSFPDDPVVEARTRLLLGMTYKGQGHYDRAEEHFRAALALYRDEHRVEHVDIAESLRLLGLALALQGRFDEALPRLEEALGMNRALGGEGDFETTRTHSALAFLFIQAGRAEEAEPHARAALEGCRRAGDQEGFAVATSNLARVLRARGDFDEAERVYREAAERLAEELDPEHPLVAGVRSNLGLLYYHADRLDEARVTLTSARDILVARLTRSHPLLGTVRMNLGVVLDGLKEYELATAELEAALAAYADSLGRDSDDYALALNHLAYVLWNRGLWREASARYEELADHHRRNGGDEEGLVTVNDAFAAEVLGYEAGGLDAAVAALEEHYAARLEAAGEADGVTQAIVRCLIRLYAHYDKTETLALWEARQR